MSLRELEKELVAPKHWSLLGETGGKKRPRNALLEETLEVNRAEAPSTFGLKEINGQDEDEEGDVVEAEGKKSDFLERIIKQRVCQGLFDNVAHLQKETATNSKTAEDLAADLIDTSAPKTGLTEMYAGDAFKGTSGTTGVEKTEQKCLQLWRALNRNLDQLVESSYVPKPIAIHKIES